MPDHPTGQSLRFRVKLDGPFGYDAWMKGLNEGQQLNYELEQGQRGRVSAVNLRPT